MTKKLLSIFLIFLFALNSISVVIPFTDLSADIELHINTDEEGSKQQEEQKESESKEHCQFFTAAANSISTELSGQKSKPAYPNSSFAEEVNLSNPTPPPEQA
ncbi:MAG: hypothetical protein IPK31_12345 [Chitinophagaceae bacterium]|nr:hypothetical protein [Chitinophagaceae bacterium]